MSLLLLNNVSVKYGTGDSAVFALKNFNIEINKGERIAITGPSGAGKSTLLSVLGGIEKPTNGSMEYDGKEYYKLPSKISSKIRLNEFGFVFQAFYLISTLSVKDNILLPVVASKNNIDIDFFDDIVETLSLRDRLTHCPNELSGGEKQRVAIARAMINKPKVIFADEPSGNLDSSNGEIVFEKLFEMSRKHGQTLIYVTHDIEKAKMAERIIKIKDGVLDE